MLRSVLLFLRPFFQLSYDICDLQTKNGVLSVRVIKVVLTMSARESSSLRVLMVSQELQPYAELSSASYIVRNLLPYLHKNRIDVRLVMPRYKTIHEKKHKLHHVIRLSGMNIRVLQEDYDMQVKVVTLPDVRYQVYFIDNDELFRQGETLTTLDGSFVKDNGLRYVFFSRAVLEMMIKLGWVPHIVHCHGWFTTLIPFYIEKLYRDEPVFKNAKLVLSVYDDFFNETLEDLTVNMLKVEKKLPESELKQFEKMSYADTYLNAARYVNGIILASPYLDPSLTDVLKARYSGKILLEYPMGADEREFLSKHAEVYRKLVESPISLET